MWEALQIDIHSENDDYPISWIDAIAYTAAKHGNNFTKAKKSDIHEFETKIKQGFSVEEMGGDLFMKYERSNYYLFVPNTRTVCGKSACIMQEWSSS